MTNNTIKDFIKAAHKLCEGCEYYKHGCELLTSDCPKPFTPEMKADLLGITICNKSDMGGDEMLTFKR